MKIRILNNFWLTLISLSIGLLIAILFSEVVFFITHGGWYKNLGLHVRQNERLNITKDKNLISGYEQESLHRAPDNNSALREYVELINFQKKAQVFRILCIGGSTTRGVGLEKSQSYPAFLQQRFDAFLPGRFEVFNLGLHFGTTRDFRERFYKASADTNFGWRDLNPDLVILAPVWNDLRLELCGVGYDEKIPVIGNLKWKDLLNYTKTNLSSRLALGYYIYKAIAIMHEKALATYYSHNLDVIMARLENAKARFRNRIIEIINLWQERKVKVYLVVFPGLIEENWPGSLIKDLLKLNYPESAYFEHSLYPLIQKSDREVIVSIAKEYKISCYDFSDIATGIPVANKVGLFVDAVHMGAQINNFIAEKLFRGITNDLGLSRKNTADSIPIE